MMGAPPPGSMPPNGPSSGYGPPQRTGYSNGYGRDRPSAPPPRFNDRGYQNQEKHGEDWKLLCFEQDFVKKWRFVEF